MGVHAVPEWEVNAGQVVRRDAAEKRCPHGQSRYSQALHARSGANVAHGNPPTSRRNCRNDLAMTGSVDDSMGYPEVNKFLFFFVVVTESLWRRGCLPA
jgi:hypothetical protein